MIGTRTPLRFLVAPMVAAAFTLCGCASRPRPQVLPGPPPRETRPATPIQEGSAVLALERRLSEALTEYGRAINLLEAGEEVAGERRVVLATAEIRAAAGACTAMPGCSLDLLLDGLEQAFGRHELALKRQASRIAELETDVAELSAFEREPGTSPFAAALPEIARTESLLRGNDLRRIITLNGPVNAAIDDWLTWMRPMLLEAWEQYQYLREEIAPVYEQAGLPEALLFAMIATESGGKVHAFSSAGAAGPLQFMRRTGQVYGLGVDDGFDQRLDPVAATGAAVGYLDDRFNEFNDSLEKALAAYNGGESRMRRIERSNPGASLWDRDMYWSLPRETREYVPRILAAAWLFLHPEDYALEFPAVDARKAALTLLGPISIGELAVCLGEAENPGGWFRTLRNLNPRLGPGERLEAGDRLRVPAVVPALYERQCLEGPLLENARRLHDANYPEQPEMVPYVVRRHDTLGRIASRHDCVTLRQLAELNGVRPPRYVIHVGQRLKIPGCD